MIVYPAIDLRHGRCVRLQQGDVNAETVFAADPVDAALRWADEGAAWLHIVNLDGALGESGAANLEALTRIVSRISLPVQFGGGVRSLEDIGALLDLGVARVVLGTVAVREPALVSAAVDRFGPERIMVGIDARQGHVVVSGWVEASAVDAASLARRVAAQGVRRIVYTDVARDGMLQGVDAEGAAELARASGVGIIASGGVSTVEDLRVLRAFEPEGVEGAIIGMALYRGMLSLREAIAIAGGD